MKILLFLSLAMNLALGILYWRETQRPPLERIIVEEKAAEKRSFKPQKIQRALTQKNAPSGASMESGPEPILASDTENLQREAEEIESLKRDYFDRVDIPESTLRQKEKIMQDFYLRSAEIYRKHPTGITLSFEERRLLLDLEEEAHQKIRSLFTEKKWKEYKSFVDRYNKKVIESSKTGESTGILMGY